jgi:hypothetical protein
MTTATETYRYGRLHIAHFAREVPALAIGRAVYFPLRALCEQLGLAPQKQIGRLKADSRFRPALRDIPIPTIKGLREAVCIRKQDVAPWLITVDPAKCAHAKTRAKLEEFQSELFAAADRFLWGDTGATVYDPATKTASPVTGLLRVGECPNCGARLCLTFDDGPAHLIPDPEETT